MALASRSHCLSSAAAHRRAPNARPELTRGRYRSCTMASSASTCSTHVTRE
uniref:Ocl5 n=1 Tax=Arundo donax TaxID=35708 RepID=A0A0A9F3H9_ARUDO